MKEVSEQVVAVTVCFAEITLQLLIMNLSGADNKMVNIWLD
jgi:hypothetical protein